MQKAAPLRVGAERHLGPEALFQPELQGKEQGTAGSELWAWTLIKVTFFSDLININTGDIWDIRGNRTCTEFVATSNWPAKAFKFVGFSEKKESFQMCFCQSSFLLTRPFP